MVQGVFTTEAARNTAITSPTEGMIVYLTAPTEPSGTGMTITGIRQVYDGAAWTTISPITGIVAAFETLTSATYADAPTAGPAVSIRTGITALVTISAQLRTSSTRYTFATFAVSGATTIAAADVNCVSLGSSVADLNATVSRTYLLTGLTAGVNTFTMKYRRDVNNTTAGDRSITVQGIA